MRRQLDVQELSPTTTRVHAAVARRARFEARRTDDTLADELTAAIAAVPHAAVAWECAPLGPDLDDTPIEMVLIDHPALAQTHADPSPFAGKFGDTPIATFPNLGGDAVLVTPNPRVAPRAAHLRAFVREAPPTVVRVLWHAVGVAVVERRATHAGPLWVSTAGLGVSWLHVRLDDHPKYYRHRPFAAR